jgi:hypothetical protein
VCASGPGGARAETPFTAEAARGASFTVALAGDRIDMVPGLPLDAETAAASSCTACHVRVPQPQEIAGALLIEQQR